MRKYAICLETLERGFEWLVVPWEKAGATKFQKLSQVPNDHILLSVWPAWRSPVKEWAARGNNYIEIDYGYWGINNPRRNTRRVTYNGSHNLVMNKIPYSRVNSLFPAPGAWKVRPGKYILCIEPNADTYTERTGISMADWKQSLEAKIKQHWYGEIKWRRKVGGKRPDRWPNFLAELSDAQAVVGERTMACAEAVILGYPAYTLDHSVSSLVMGDDFSKIAKPEYPDRTQWLEHIAWSQFHPDEFSDGTKVVELVELYQIKT